MSEEAQKSVAHETTDDATESPGNSGRTIPAGDKFHPDNAAKATGQANPAQRTHDEPTEAEKRARKEDQSDYGGPLDLDDPEAIS